MKDYIIILLILFGVSTRISAQKSTSIEFIQKGVEYAQKENYDLAIFYLKLNIKENNIPDSIRVKGCFYLQHAYYLSGHSDFSWDLLKHYSLLYDSPDSVAVSYITETAYILAKSGQYKEALVYGKLAEQRTKSLYGESSLEYAFALDNLSIRYRENVKIDSAIVLCKKAIQIISKTIGKRNMDYATSQNNLALLYYEKGKYNKAISHKKKAVKLHKLLKSDTTSSYAILLDYIGVIYKSKGNMQKSIDYNYKSIKILQAINDTCSIDYITVLNNLAIKYCTIGQYDTAIKIGHNSLSLSQKLVETNNICHAIALHIIASAHLSKGDIQNYIQSVSKAIPILENTIGENHSIYIDIMKELIHIHITTGNYIQAIPFIEKGIENIISLYGENSFIIINWLIDLATCYKYGVGNDSQLLLLCEKVLNLAKIHYKKESLIYAQTIHNICTILDEIIPSEILLAIEEEVFSIRKKLLPHNHPQYLSSLNSIITYYTKCNMLKEAISIGEQMLNTNKKNMDGALLHNLAIAYSKTGNVPKAIHLLEKTSEIYKKEFGKCNIHYLNNLSDLCLNYHKAQLHDNVKKTVEELIFITDKMSFKDLLLLNQKERNYYWNNVYLFTQLFSYFAYQHKDDEDYIRLAYDAALRFKNIHPTIHTKINEQYASYGNNPMYNDYKEFLTIERKINVLQERTANKKEIDLLKRQSKKLNRKLSQTVILNTDIRKLIQLKWKDIQSYLSPSSVAIEFVNVPIEKDNHNYIALILKKAWDSPKIVSFSLSTNDSTKFDWHSHQLYNIIWKPIEQYLSIGDTIHFSASDILHKIPIESLPVGNGKIMSDIYHMHRLSSTRELALKKDPIKYKKAALYGGLNYDMTDSDMKNESSKYQKEDNTDILSASRGLLEDSIRGHKWIQLGNTRKEVEYIKELLEKSHITANIFKGNSGNEESFKALSGQEYNIIHLATHGFFYPNEVAKKKDYFKPILMQDELNISPTDMSLWRSGLVLSGGNRAWKGDSIPEEVEDGILKSQEIKDLDLRGADLVVLSACHTGQGEVTNEGVFGLQRAFKMAGVQTIVMSLTEADDQTTMAMMNKFYTSLLSGQSKHDAFYNAQRYIRSIKPDPIYWAGWIMLD